MDCLNCSTICAPCVRCEVAEKERKKKEVYVWRKWITWLAEGKTYRHSGNSLLTLISALSTELSKHATQRRSEHEAHYFRLNAFSSPLALQTLFFPPFNSTFNTHPIWITFQKERELFSNFNTATQTHSYTPRTRWQNGCCVKAGLFPSYLSVP